jgi:transglutaminase-like putative cysteine protease
MAIVLERTEAATREDTAVNRYEIDDQFTVAPPNDAVGDLNVWAPVIPETPYQRLLDVSVEGPKPWALHRDQEFGNAILHARLLLPMEVSETFHIRYRVERLPIRHDLARPVAQPVVTPALFSRSLHGEQFVDVDDKTRALARDIAGDETNILEQARRLYDHVISSMSYNAEEQSWKGSTEHALVCSMGNCNDIHALFISLCRSVGIPARLVLGQAFEPPPGEEVCELCGYHCWAEFFIGGLGWVPADASCACKYGRHGLFGDLEMNHIAWSVGRDIQLVPAPRGPRPLFFAGPYAEVNGAAYAGVDRHITFNELT